MATITQTDRLAIQSIRFRAALLTLMLLAIALIAVIAFRQWALREILIDSGEQRAKRVSAQLATVIGTPIPARIADMQRLVDDATVRRALLAPSTDAEAAAFGRVRSLAANPAQHQTLELWTASGRRVMAKQMPESGGSVPLSDAPPSGTGFRPYRVVGNRVVVQEVVTPVPGEDGGTAVGFLLLRRAAANTVTGDTLQSLVGDGGRILLGNQSGSVWMTLAGDIETLGSGTLVPGINYYEPAPGDRRIAGMAHIPNTPLALVVDFPESLLLAPTGVLLRQTATMAVIFSLVAVAVVWMLSARVTRPLDELTDAVRQVSAGDFSRRVEVHSNSEVGRLAAAFNSMAAKIESGLHELEAQALELKEKDQRKAAMMNAALDCIFTTDHEGDVLDCNPAAERVFGYDHAGFIARNIAELLKLPRYEHYSGLTDYVAGAGALAPGTRTELTGTRADRTTFPVEVSLVEVRTDGAASFAWFMRDLTDQKAAEAALLRGIVLEEENRRVQEASRLKSEFLANMSHELRTPLNAIIGFAELLHDGQVTPDMPQFKEFMHDILTSGQHLLQLINDVLDLSKVEAGRLEFHPEDTSLDQVVGETLGIVRTLAAQKRLTLTHAVDPAVTHVFVDRGRLKQVLYNYVSNAIKFTPDGGTVSIRVLPDGGDHFRIDVVDTGIGISAADQSRLFVEFNQLEAGAAKTHQGTGLGLALTKRLVEAQGGRVGVISTAGKGSTFYAVLPRRANKGTPLAHPRSILAARTGAPAVLVVEDDRDDQEAIVNVLIDAGFSVETANSRAQAIAKLSAQTFDAITLDLILPDANGADLLHDIRAGERNRDVPVVVITIVAEGAVSGFAVHDILSKPVDGGTVIASLRRAGVSAGGGGSVLVVDDDPGSLRLMAASLQQLGFRSRCVERAIDGLRISEREAPLAVVLDLQMPEMDGFGFLDHFRRMPHCEHVPVIVWTVKDLSPADLARLKSTVQGILSKGQSGRSVVEELRRFVAERQA